MEELENKSYDVNFKQSMKPLKYFDYAVTFAEFPDETALCVNISDCPGLCEGCSEPWLRDWIGTELTESEIDKLIKNNPGITLFGFMGGDNDHDDVIRCCKYIREKYPELKIGIYSGFEYINIELAQNLDLYKIGRWIMPQGPVSEWHKTNCGVLQFPWSNQLMFENKNGKLVNVTYKFRKEKINNPERFIIRSEDDENTKK